MLNKNSTILVPGASAPAGINTIKSLKLSGYRGKILSTDSNKLSAGFYMSDYSEVIPETTSDTYLEFLLKIVEKYNVYIIMPSSGHDIFPISENKNKLQKLGVTPVVSERDILEICRDKLLTFTKLNRHFELPYTFIDPNKVKKFPIIAKPRFGKGSRDILKIENNDELNFVHSRYKDMIFQDYLPGDEYTIDVLSDLQGHPIISVPRVRIQTKSGISTKGKIVLDKDLIEQSLKLVKYLKIIGPSCIQVKEDINGEFKLVEVNPRLGGGTIFTTLAGANFPQMIVDMVEGKKIEIPKISEITVLRYFEEIVLDNKNKANYIGKDLITNDVYHI